MRQMSATASKRLTAARTAARYKTENAFRLTYDGYAVFQFAIDHDSEVTGERELCGRLWSGVQV